jgi:hypothetical protein
MAKSYSEKLMQISVEHETPVSAILTTDCIRQLFGAQAKTNFKYLEKYIDLRSKDSCTATRSRDVEGDAAGWPLQQAIEARSFSTQLV